MDTMGDPVPGRDRKRPADPSNVAGATKKRPTLVVVPPAGSSFSEEQVTPTAAPQARKEKIPPIVVYDLTEEELLNLTTLVTEGGLHASFNFLKGNYTKIACATRSDFSFVIDRLTQLKREFFSHDFPGDKFFKVFLKGLRFGDPEAVERWIVESNLPRPAAVKSLDSERARKATFKNFVVSFPKGTTTLKDLQGIKRLNFITVTWERYYPRRDTVVQCRNCLRFGHGQANCSMKTRCVKCGGTHLARQCFVELEGKRRCANCEGSHSPFNPNCKTRLAYLRIKEQQMERQNAKYVPAPVPTSSAWDNRLPWSGQQQMQRVPQHHQRQQEAVRSCPVNNSCSCHCCKRHQAQAAISIQPMQQTFQHQPIQQQPIQQQMMQPQQFQQQPTQQQPTQQQPIQQQPTQQQMMLQKPFQQHPTQQQPTQQQPTQQQPLQQQQQHQPKQKQVAKQPKQQKPQNQQQKQQSQQQIQQESSCQEEAMEVQLPVEHRHRQPAQDKLERLRASLADETPDISTDMALFSVIIRLWGRFQSIVKQYPREQHILMLVQLIVEALPNGY